MWDLRCDECGRAYESLAGGLRASEVSARRDGWTVGPLVQCPACASADKPDEDASDGVGQRDVPSESDS